MTTLNRLIAPPAGKIADVTLIEPEKVCLSNGIPLYFIHAPQSELVRIEFIFPAGEKHQPASLVAKAANKLIRNGTSRKNAVTIAEEIDSFGAFLETEVSMDSASLLLYTLHKHLGNVLPVMKELMMDAVYPQEELQTFLQNSRQAHLVNLEKVDFLARDHFRKLVFGEGHPYGKIVEIGDYDRLKREDVTRFYQERYQLDQCKIMLAGRIDELTLEHFEKAFGDWPYQPPATKDAGYKGKQVTDLPVREHMAKKGALQTAIRVGKPLFTRSHPHYAPMSILNTVLGGYFGSRLMSNIREDKGFTYGIRSGIVSLQDAGYFLVATEVGSHVCDAAVKEIYHELERLREELIPEEELELVKNYMLGTLLRSFDGAFAQMERFIALEEQGLDLDFYRHYMATIHEIEAGKLKEFAEQYFQPDSFIELTVGERGK